MHPKTAIVVLLGISGILLLNYALGFTFKPEKSGTSTGNSALVDPWLIIFRETCLFLGFFFLVVSLAYLYVHISLAVHKSQADMHISRDLKILDWLLIGYVVLMIPLFEVLGLPPFMWLLLILLPAVIARLIIAWLVNGRIKRDAD